MNYIVIDHRDQSHKIFKTNGLVQEFIEQLVNDEDYLLEEIMVVKVDCFKILTIEQQKKIAISIGG